MIKRTVLLFALVMRVVNEVYSCRLQCNLKKISPKFKKFSHISQDDISIRYKRDYDFV